MRPLKERVRVGKDEPFRGNVRSRLVYSSEIGPDESEYGDFYGKDYSVENKRSHELASGLALRI